MCVNEKLSIVMATYNGGKYLEQQLNSFIEQTRLPDELIISDDKSIDDTINIVEDFKKKASFNVKIINHNLNVGYTLNFERGLLASTGNLILFCDQDDIWYPNKIEELIKIAKLNSDYDLFIHDTDIADRNGNLSGFSKLEQLSNLNISLDLMAMGTCMLVRRRLVEVSTPFSENLAGHDNWINEIGRLLEVRMLIKKSFQLYRMHDSNTSDFIGNSTTKQNIIKHIYNRLKNRKSPGKSIKKRLKVLIAIMKIAPQIKLEYGEEREKIFLENLFFEKKILEERISNLDRNILNRILYLSRIIVNRNYKIYGNLMTCFNDLLGYPRY